MKEVFEGAEHGEHQRVQRHFWPGIRYNARWLLNWGVISIGRKHLLVRN
jgi:hypothetical protein